MLAANVPTAYHCKYLSAELAPLKPVVENFIHSFGGVSYDSGDLLLAKFATSEMADDCAAELGYLYQTLPVEIDGPWLAVYLT